MLLSLLYTVLVHPIRFGGSYILLLLLLLGFGCWPGWTEAKWWTVTACCFLYALPLWAWLNARTAWGRFNRLIGRRP